MNYLKDLKENFPQMWCKDGQEFGDQGAILWASGETGELPNGLPPFDYYRDDETYIMGVHVDLHYWAQAHGLYWSCYDPGTYLAYEA